MSEMIKLTTKVTITYIYIYNKQIKYVILLICVTLVVLPID